MGDVSLFTVNSAFYVGFSTSNILVNQPTLPKMTRHTCLISGDRGGISLVVFTISELMRKKTSVDNCLLCSLYQQTTKEGLSCINSMFSRLLLGKQKTAQMTDSILTLQSALGLPSNLPCNKPLLFQLPCHCCRPRFFKIQMK